MAAHRPRILSELSTSAGTVRRWRRIQGESGQGVAARGTGLRMADSAGEEGERLADRGPQGPAQPGRPERRCGIEAAGGRDAARRRWGGDGRRRRRSRPGTSRRTPGRSRAAPPRHRRRIGPRNRRPRDRRAADDGPAGEEAEHGGPGQAVAARQRTARHQGTGRVELLLGADQDPGRQQGEPGMGVEPIGGERQRTGRPPRIVVAEGDVRRPGRLHADRPRRAPRFLYRSIRWTSGCSHRTKLPVSSDEPLSTRITRGASGRPRSRASVSPSWPTRSRVAITTEMRRSTSATSPSRRKLSQTAALRRHPACREVPKRARRATDLDRGFGSSGLETFHPYGTRPRRRTRLCLPLDIGIRIAAKTARRREHPRLGTEKHPRRQ